MKLEIKTKVGKKRVIVIPKKIADIVGIKEGSEVKVTISDDGVLIKPVIDAIELSLKGKKITKITLDELEADSLDLQEKYHE